MIDKVCKETIVYCFLITITALVALYCGSIAGVIGTGTVMYECLTTEENIDICIDKSFEFMTGDYR